MGPKLRANEEMGNGKITVMIIDEQVFPRAGLPSALSQRSDFEILDSDPSQDILGLIENSLPSVVLLGSALATHIELEKGLLVSRLKPNAVRFMPPLVIGKQEVDTALGILDEVLSGLAGQI